MTLCGGCKQIIIGRQFLVCTNCKEYYDLECANVSETRFYGTLIGEHRTSWICPACHNKKRKTNNSNCIVGPLTTNHDESANITVRRKQLQSLEDSIDDKILDESILGETLNDTFNVPTSVKQSITLEELGELINGKLEKNNQQLIADIKSIIHSEIINTISNLKIDFNQKTDALSCQQTIINNDIADLNRKISNLETKNKKLQNEINTLLDKSQNFNTRNTEQYQDHLNCKRIVLHGLQEFRRENEMETHDRVINIFGEIMNVNLFGYIEELTRIGRQGNKRPLIIELLSKKLTRHLLQNKQYFQNTGLYITEYLNKNEIKDRKELIKTLQKARKDGQHAVIRNNKLIINGKIIHPNQIQETKETVKNYLERGQENTLLEESSLLKTPCSKDPDYFNKNTESVGKNYTFRY